jgi:hypothetical protein
VSKKLGFLDFNHSGTTEQREYEAFDAAVTTLKTTGTTIDIAGPFGFSGRFDAFFLNDELRVPLEARVKMFLGSAVVKLVEYRRTPSITSN